MRIKAVQLQRVRLPLASPYVFGRGSVDKFENIIVRIKGENGLEGIGECVVRSIISSLDFAEKELQEKYIPVIIGMDSMDVEAIIKKLEPEECPDLGPIAGIDLALWDLNGKVLGLPVYKLIGGAYNLDIPVSYTLTAAPPEKMASQALSMTDYGYQTFVIKVSHGSLEESLEEDVERVRLIREAVGPSIKLRIDANAAWNVERAIEVLQAVECYNLEYIEQPIPPGDIEGLKKIAANQPIPISVDEDLQYLSDALTLAESGAVKFFNIKVPQCGGLWLSKKVAAIAESAGISVTCGGRLALEIVRQASRHFVASTAQACLGYAHEGPGPASQAITATVTNQTLRYEDVKAAGGKIQLSDALGLGVELDGELVRKYAA